MGQPEFAGMSPQARGDDSPPVGACTVCRDIACSDIIQVHVHALDPFAHIAHLRDTRYHAGLSGSVHPTWSPLVSIYLRTCVSFHHPR